MFYLFLRNKQSDAAPGPFVAAWVQRDREGWSNNLQTGGAIVNTSSNAALRGLPNQAAYVAAKASVIGLTKTATVEYAALGIRVNALCPGLVMPPHLRAAVEKGLDWRELVSIPMGRSGEPCEIAEMAVWLSSPRPSYVTGQVISVDGAMMAAMSPGSLRQKNQAPAQK